MTDKPILTVDVDDEKFKRFYSLFQQYSEKLEEQPAAWKKLNDVITETSHTLGKPAKKVADHFSDASDSSGEVLKSLSASTKAMQDLFAATQKSNAAMSTLLTSTRGVGKGLFDAGAGLLGIKNTLGLLGVIPGFGSAIKLAGVVAGVAAAAGDMALRSAGSVSDTARSAFGANSTYGQFQNANAQLSPFLPNPGGALQTVAANQWNPASQGMLGLFGVTSQESPAKALASILRQGAGTLRQTHNLALPQVTYAEQATGLTPTDMISLANQNPKDLNHAINNMLDPKLSDQQGVSKPVISSDQRLQASWATSMNTASAKFAAALAPFNPAVAKFGQDVAKFAGLFSSKAQGAAKVASEMGLVQNNLPPILGGRGNGPNGINPNTGLPNTAPAAGASNGIQSGGKMSGLTTYSAVMQSFLNRGYSKKFAAAMASMGFSESSFHTYAPTTYKGQKYGGMLQWNQDRRDQILKATGIDVWGKKTTEDQEVAAADWEFRNTKFGKNAAAHINASPNAITAGTAADKYYEVSHDNDAQRLIRGARAGAMYAMGPNAPGPHSQPPQQNLPPDVTALLKRLAKQPPIKVTAHISNSTSAKVAMSANAAVN